MWFTPRTQTTPTAGGAADDANVDELDDEIGEGIDFGGE